MTTISQRRKALEALPADLYDSFQGVITRIRECPRAGQAKLGVRVLMWLHFAYRPLKLEELQHALAVEKSHTEFDMENIPPRKALLDSCLGMVIVDEETLTIRFVHYTLEEYFRKYTKTEFPNGCYDIAETCLTYLNFGELRPHCTNLDTLRKKISTYVFLNYAACYWGTYVKQQCSDGLRKLAAMILDHESKRPPCAIQALYLEVGRWWKQCIAQGFSGIHVAAYFGLSEDMTYVCNIERDIQLKDEFHRTPLSWAAENGHEAVVRLLVERGDVDNNAKDSYGQTPLSYAAGNGHEAVVRLLVERDDADINAKDNYGRTPLLLAAQDGHEAVVRLLVERGDVDTNAKDSFGRTPLLLAAENGHEAVVRLLAEGGGVDINAKHIYGRTPLSFAAKNGHEAVVRLLTERDDVDINAKDNGGQTALSLAVQCGNEAVVRLLVERDDVDTNAKDNDGQTALSWAAENGHEAVVRLLENRPI